MKTLMYIGPTLKNGMLRQFTVFTAGIPPYLSRLFDSNDALRGLLVELKDVATARLEMQKKGNILNLYAKRVMKEI